MIDVDQGIRFLDFVTGRHKVWEARQRGDAQPWTSDPVLATRKFTNTFRWIDPGSQFVIKELMEPEITPEEFLMRCFLYRHTGRVEAWEYLPLALGGYPLTSDLDEVLEAWKDYRGATRQKVQKTRWSKKETPHMDSQRTVFTSAYLVFPQSQERGTDKLVSIVNLTKRLFQEEDFAQRFLEEETQEGRFSLIKSNKGVGDFMAMQILTDFGYGTEYKEDQYVVCGPGAVKGAKALSTQTKAREVLDWAHEAVLSHPETPEVAGRNLSKMDVQNCLCEFSKYVRFADKPSPEKLYQPAHPGVQLDPVVPPLWTTP